MAPIWRAQAGARAVLSFALAPGDAAGEVRADLHADLSADARWDGAALAWQVRLRTPAGAVDFALGMPGVHNVRNALAAAACALAAGLGTQAIARGLGAFAPVAGRSQTRSLRWRGQVATLVDDSYNANPDSVLAAIDVLASLPGPRWLVLGDMAEVGAQGPAFHAEVGARARERGIEQVWCAGPLCAHAARAAGAAALHFAGVEALIEAIPSRGPQAASVLVKGSRSMRMERVVQALQSVEEAACC
jgi:UDP-N-acetylmuramoyl-tripeptide--D-alanyl-D-alanine ligase